MFKFSWECNEADGMLNLFAPGVDRIEWEVARDKGAVDGEYLRLASTSESTWIRLHRGEESTRWVLLKPGISDIFDLASARHRFEMGV